MAKVKKTEIQVISSQVNEFSDIKKKNLSFHIRNEFASNAPRNSTELWYCIKNVFGVEIPITACSEWATPPFKKTADIYFGRAPTSVTLASRNSGKTYTASIEAWLNNTFKPGWSHRHAAANREQAKVASNYLSKFWDDPVISSKFLEKPGLYEAKWKNGGSWKILTGSVAGTSGNHPNCFSADEIEFWEIAAVEQTWAVPVASNGWPAVWSAFSTRQRSYGCMAWLIEEAPKRNITVFQWTVFETMRPCPSCLCIKGDQVISEPEKKCILWSACQGVKGMKSTGWIPREDVAKLCISMGGPESVAWRTQGLCELTSVEGLVLHNFFPEYKPKGNYTTWTYKSELAYYIGMDPPEGKKGVCSFFQVFNNAQYVFDELIVNPCASTASLKEKLLAFIEEKGYPFPENIIVDPRRTDAVNDLRNSKVAGINFRAVAPSITETSGGQGINIGYNRLRTCIGSGRFFINPENCPGLVRGIKEIHFSNDDTETVAPQYKDEGDAMRYANDYFLQVLGKRGISIGTIELR